MAENTNVNVADGTNVETPNTGAGTADGSGGGAKPVSLKDDDLVEVVWKGQTVTKPWKEARANIQMQEDYTRSKQELASRAKEVQDLYDTLTSRQKSIAEKETALDAILGRAPNTDSNTVKLDPEATPTVAQIQQMLKEHAENLTKTVFGKVDEATKQTEEVRTFQRWEDLTNDAADRLVKEHPILDTIPQLAVVLKKQALSDKPTNEKEMVAAIVKAGKDIAKKLDDAFTEREKAKALKRSNLSDKGPEPKGGGINLAPPANKSYMKGRNKIDFDSIERDAIAAIEAMDE